MLFLFSAAGCSITEVSVNCAGRDVLVIVVLWLKAGFLFLLSRRRNVYFFSPPSTPFVVPVCVVCAYRSHRVKRREQLNPRVETRGNFATAQSTIRSVWDESSVGSRCHARAEMVQACWASSGCWLDPTWPTGAGGGF
jgi:hypothetical protein